MVASVVVNVALHCLYLPAGSPEVTGVVPPTDVQDGLGAFFAKDVSEARTLKVMPVPATVVELQNGESQSAPVIPVSST
jgi:hypothetical protein